MIKAFTFLVTILLMTMPVDVRASAPSAESTLRHFVFVGGDDPANHKAVISDPEVEGIQVVYSWKRLESGKGEYDFSAIERDIAFAKANDRELFIQLQDRFFRAQDRNIPAYLLEGPVYAGGLERQQDNAGEGQPKGTGWVTKQWEPAVRERFQALIAALGERFDGKIAGINLPETAIEISKDPWPDGFSCDGYFDATMENLRAARAAFSKSKVVQYVNFWPCEWNNDRQYMGRIFEAALDEGIGLGGPDIIPYRRAQEKNSYQFFAKHKGQLPLVATAVQGPTLTYTNPKTGQPFTRAEFEDYAVNVLGVDIIFWTVRARK